MNKIQCVIEILFKSGIEKNFTHTVEETSTCTLGKIQAHVTEIKNLFESHTRGEGGGCLNIFDGSVVDFGGIDMLNITATSIKDDSL